MLILREVLGFSGEEVAEALETTPASVYSALQRAHKSVDARLPERSQQATLRALGDDALREIVDAFVVAWERGDVDALAAMLAEEATIAMPPMPTWYRGRDAVAGFLAALRCAPGSAGASSRLGRAASWPSASTAGTTRRGPSSAHGIIVLTLDGPRIADAGRLPGAGRLPPFRSACRLDGACVNAAGDRSGNPERTGQRKNAQKSCSSANRYAERGLRARRCASSSSVADRVIRTD